MDEILYEKIITETNSEIHQTTEQLFCKPRHNVNLSLPVCKCNKTISVTKKRNTRFEQFKYPVRDPVKVKKTDDWLKEIQNRRLKTFQIEYEGQLSSVAKLLLNSFQKKYIYYAIDDILYLLKSNPIERDNLLSILYSPLISLHNNLYIHFFDVWIHEIYINEIHKENKFLNNKSQRLKPTYCISIKLLYIPPKPIKKKKSLW